MNSSANRLTVGIVLAVALLSLWALPAAAVQPAAKGALIDVNAASQKDLESLPGVGAATAKKIIAGRPYATIADLAKAGVPARTIERITPLVTVGAGMPPAPVAPPPAMAKPPKATMSTAGGGRPAGAAALLDLNTASERDLQGLPGRGPVRLAEGTIALPGAAHRGQGRHQRPVPLELLQGVRGDLAANASDHRFRCDVQHLP